jgi:hypothetical protein
MRVLILFSIVGVALYGLLLATDSALRDHEAPRAAHSDQRSHPSDRTLRAWGSNLSALVIQPQAPQAQPQQPAGQNGRDQQLATLGKSTATEVYVREQQPAPGASGSETATESPVENELSAPKSSMQVATGSKQRVRSAKSAVNASDRVITKWEMRRGRWAGRDDRRRRFGLFGRRFATFDAW